MPGGRGLEQVCVAAPRMLSGGQARMIHLTARLPVGRKGPQDSEKSRVCRGLRRAEENRPGSWLTTGGRGLQAREVLRSLGRSQ